MQIDVVNMEGKKVGQMELADAVFGTRVKDYLFWEVVKAQLAARRAGTHATAGLCRPARDRRPGRQPAATAMAPLPRDIRTGLCAR